MVEPRARPSIKQHPASQRLREQQQQLKLALPACATTRTRPVASAALGRRPPRSARLQRPRANLRVPPSRAPSRRPFPALPVSHLTRSPATRIHAPPTCIATPRCAQAPARPTRRAVATEAGLRPLAKPLLGASCNLQPTPPDACVIARAAKRATCRRAPRAQRVESPANARARLGRDHERRCLRRPHALVAFCSPPPPPRLRQLPACLSAPFLHRAAAPAARLDPVAADDTEPDIAPSLNLAPR